MAGLQNVSDNQRATIQSLYFNNPPPVNISNNPLLNITPIAIPVNDIQITGNAILADGNVSTLDQFSSEIYASLGTVGIERMSRFMRHISLRTRNNTMMNTNRFGTSSSLAATGGSYSASTSSLSTDKIQLISNFEAETTDEFNQSCGSCCSTDCSCYSSYGANGWVSVNGVSGAIQGDGNASSSDFDLDGIAFGYERWQSENLLWGVAGGHTNTDFSTSNNLNFADVDSYNIATHVLVRNGCSYLLGLLAYGYDDFSTRRNIQVLGRQARGEYNGYGLGSYLEGGLYYQSGDWQIQPLVSLQYVLHEQDRFTETGAGGANLMVNTVSTDSLRGSLGARISRSFLCCESWTIMPELRLRYVQELVGNNDIATSNFSGAGLPSFSSQGVGIGNEFGNVGTGLAIKLIDSVFFYADYDLEFTFRQTVQTGTGAIAIHY